MKAHGSSMYASMNACTINSVIHCPTAERSTGLTNRARVTDRETKPSLSEFTGLARLLLQLVKLIC